MKKLLCAVLVVCSLVACFSCKDKNKENGKNSGNEINGITINQGSEISMVQGSNLRLSIKTDPADLKNVAYTYSSADPSHVEVDENGIIYANMITESPVQVTVTATLNGKSVSASISVTVTSLVDALVFDELILMKSTKEWQEQTYAIYEIRRYSTQLDAGSEADMSHVVTQESDTAGDAKYNRDYIPADGKYTFLYTKENSETGKLDTIGVFKDSVETMRAWIISEDCIFTQDGFSVIDNGAVFEFTLCFLSKNNIAYVLGEHDIVDNVTEHDKIRPAGVSPMPMPSTIQAAEFDSESYIDFFTRLMADEEVSLSDYDFFRKYDAFIMPAYQVEDEESGESYGTTMPLFGYPVAGGAFELDQPSRSGGVNWLSASAYAFEAWMYDNPTFGYCFKIIEVEDPETGEKGMTYDLDEDGNLQMSEPRLVNFTKGISQQAPRHNAVNPVDNAKPMSMRAVRLMQNVNSAIYSTLQYAMTRR